MCSFQTPRCSSSFPPPFAIIHPWRNEVVPTLDVITGRGTPGVTVRVKINGEEPELTTVVDADGWWSIPVPEALPPGGHIIYAAQFFGRICETFTLPFSIQLPLLPTPIILHPEDGSMVEAGWLTVNGSGGPGNLVTICLDGTRCRTRTVESDGLFSTRFRRPGIEPGTHVVTVTEKNPLTGQVSLTATSTFVAIPRNGEATESSADDIDD